MNETYLKYSNLYRCARMAAELVSYLAGKEKRPMTEQENAEWQRHQDNANRFRLWMQVTG